MRPNLAVLVSAIMLAPAAFAVPDGYPDSGFGQNGRQVVAFDLGGLNADAASGVAVLPDGRIILSGPVMRVDGYGIGLARLTPAGAPDASFGQPAYFPAGLFVSVAYDLAVQTDGKLVIAGIGTYPATTAEHALVCRFLPNGAPDLGFASALPNPLAGTGCRTIETGEASSFSAVALQPDGRIILAGGAETGELRAMVVRLDAQGNFDSSFDSDGIHVLLPESTHPTMLTDIATTPQGHLVAVGYAIINGNSNWQVFRLRGNDGLLDPEFDDDGLKPIAIDLVADGDDVPTAVSVLPDGSVIVGGTAHNGPESRCPAVARLEPDGQFDNTLDGDGLFVATIVCDSTLDINDMLVQSDSRIVLAGGAQHDFYAIRVLAEGGLDEDFGFVYQSWTDFGDLYGAPDTSDTAYRIASHNGRLLLAGWTYTDEEGGQDFAIARLNNDLIFADDLE